MADVFGRVVVIATSEPSSPLISVVFALPDHRGYFDEILESWISRQTLDASDYEFLLVSGPSDAEVLHQLKPRMREQDQALLEDDDGILFLMHRGAERASGDVILFTESHCFAHPECLENVLHHFADGTRMLGQCFHVNMLENRFAELEQRMESPRTRCVEEPYWNLVRKRGFAIRRSLYFEAGGFLHEFEYFSERAFAHTLFRMGHRSEFLFDAVVFHYNTTSLPLMAEHHQDYARGMCLYRETMPQAEAEEAFGPLPVWDEREWFRYDSRMKILFALLRSWASHRFKQPAAVAAFAARALVPLDLRIFSNELGIALAAARTKWSKGAGDNALRWYTEYWRRIVKRVHLKTIAEDLESDAEKDAFSRDCRWTARRLTDLPHWGLHPLEVHEECEMRWTGRIAMVRPPVSEGERGELTLTLHPASPGPSESGLELFVEGENILKSGEWDEAGKTWRGEVRFLSDGSPLAFFCWKPQSFPGDSRELGVAVDSVMWTPLG